ncbi:MAG: alpha-galactosidase [Anaerolineales bacterium]|nr:alpha-galactosidase [Anaerolineales bacterium]
MISFNPTTRTFNLHLQNSYYAFQIDEQDRLLHTGWGIRPRDAASDDVVSGLSPHLPFDPPWSFITQYRPDEILTFGDVTAFQATLKASFPTLPQPLAAGESAHLPVRDLRLRYLSHVIVTDAQPGLAPTHGIPVENTTPRETLRVRLKDPVQAIFVTLCYRLTPEHDIIERWLELENAGAETVTLDVCYFSSLHLPNGTTELTHVTGTWAREFTPHRERLGIGTRVLESRSLQTSHNTNPFFMLNRPGHAWEETGTVYFGALAYSGSWQMAFEQLPTLHMRVHAGYNPSDDQLALAPGERHTTPAFVTGVCPDGWGGASRRFHAFTRERVLPRPVRDSRFRPVLYNGWEASYFDLSYAGQAELSRKAAAMGVELFCVDDGWFGARRSDHAGLGDWFVRADAFPEGLEALVAEVHRLGMKFGLWVEPEMVNPDSDLYRAHPEWVLHFPGRPRTESRNQLILDFGREEVVEYIFNLLDTLVGRYAISFFKWDMNRLATEPGSVAGQAIWRRHVAGVYSLMDRLRAKHPGLDIQSCSGGGGRVDVGILGRTDQVWVSDNTDALDRIRIQEGYSLAYPARTMEAWVTHEHNHQTGRVLSLGLRFDVAMRGVLGIGSSLNQLSEAELAEYARYIAFYKRIRPVVQDGVQYRLERLEEFGASVVEYVLPDGSEAVFSVVVREYLIGVARPAALLKGLRSAATYAILDRDEKEIYRATGYELMTLGLPLETIGPVGYSRTLHLKRV